MIGSMLNYPWYVNARCWICVDPRCAIICIVGKINRLCYAPPSILLLFASAFCIAVCRDWVARLSPMFTRPLWNWRKSTSLLIARANAVRTITVWMTGRVWLIWIDWTIGIVKLMPSPKADRLINQHSYDPQRLEYIWVEGPPLRVTHAALC